MPRVAPLRIAVVAGTDPCPIAEDLATGLAAARLSQDRLGQMLGLRRTTVNASCRALQQAGVIRTVRGEIRIHSAEALKAAACGCRQAERSPAPTGPRSS